MLEPQPQTLLCWFGEGMTEETWQSDNLNPKPYRRRFWFGEGMTEETWQSDNLRRSIEESLRSFTGKFTILLCSLLAIWGGLALASQRRRSITEWRRVVLRQKLGVTKDMAGTKVP
jgi:hypothetical protein